MENFLISEGFVLLSNDSKRLKKSFMGKKRFKEMYVVSALFLDLLSLDLITFELKGKIHIQTPTNKINDETVNMFYSLIAEQKPKTFEKWIIFFYMSSKNRVAIYRYLTKNIDNKTRQKDVIVRKLRARLLENDEVTVEMILLALLLTHSKVLNEFFTEYELKQVKSKIDDFKKKPHGKWDNIQCINRCIAYMDIIILKSTILV